MRANDKTFAGAIPEIYDKYMVPMLFAPYAEDLARRVVAAPVRDVLETAAGSGAVTRVLAPLLPAEARFVVTDLNPPMLEQAKRQQGGDARIEWQVADALDLPLPDASFDAVCCQFGVMFFPDRVKGYAEARRVLRPGGRFLFNVWDRIEENVFADIVFRAAGRLLPEAPPQFMARTPHGHGNPDTLRAELMAAGFETCEIEKLTLTSRAQEASHPAIALTRGTPMFGELIPHGEELVQRVIETATQDIRDRFGSGAVAAPMQAYVVTAA